MAFKVLKNVQHKIESVCAPLETSLTTSEGYIDQLDASASRMKKLGRIQNVDYDELAVELTARDDEPVIGPAKVEEFVAPCVCFHIAVIIELISTRRICPEITSNA